MLLKPTKGEIEQYMDFAYQLTLDPSRSGYPIYTDGIKTKEDFEETIWKGVRSSNWELLMFQQNGVPTGFIEFFAIPEDKYLQTVMFSIVCCTETALAEFETYCKEKYAGYTMYIGFPWENQNAITYLQEQHWKCNERLWNDVVHLEQYSVQEENEDIFPVNQENFSDFRKIHIVDEETYWNADRIYQALNQWKIYIYYRDKKPLSTLIMQCDSMLSEIFGIDFADGVFEEEVYIALLGKAMNVCKEAGQKHLCFFNDNEGQKAALKAGFTCVGEYVLYTKTV